MIAAGIALAAVLALSFVPTPARAAARAVLVLALVFSPLVALGVLLAGSPRTRLGTWFLFLPAALIWCSVLDIVWGGSARLARMPRFPARAR